MNSATLSTSTLLTFGPLVQVAVNVIFYHEARPSPQEIAKLVNESRPYIVIGRPDDINLNVPESETIMALFQRIADTLKKGSMTQFQKVITS